ncbi:16S rRNA (cytidine1402-2'-O)-methyltransferase [Seinonella peptonophila]|uniref:Ribosomal RNA small subunit methyltransferase I n=1 Tax=Seinonella peptonophila TaxID=112248 RepID=A0A1M4YKN3_9BACL|nr:16S rRNA (cytidine(1402)-2'-O)-methyltransferase [Seinonella peptonophila]SHF06311.1 16S rRNA (cytidine1402-2'-O)-methyltransferase [Seinonella peptonophila]
MQIQKSFDSIGGKLYLVATPIGNLQDMSTRALNILQEVDLIAAEDTRHTRKLLNHFQFSTPLVSLHEHNETQQLHSLIDRLKKGSQIAVVSDAGTPAISDPGEKLVAAAVEQGIDVIPVPGANAALAALIGSGLPVQPFLFYGFLPRTQKKRQSILHQLNQLEVTAIFYESPYRMVDTLRDIQSVCGDQCEVVVVRELTKRYEEWLRGNVVECCEYIQQEGSRGEYTIVIRMNGLNEAEENAWWNGLSLSDHVDHYMKQGQSKKGAIQQVSDERHLPKREVYNQYHQNMKQRGE